MNRVSTERSGRESHGQHGGDVRVLFVGNSYTFFNDMPYMFSNLSAEVGVPVETAMVAPGGTSL